MQSIHSAVPNLTEAKEALSELATQEALFHLEAALRKMEGLADSLRNGDPLPASEQRLLEKSLLRFRAELRDAGILADCGLAYCRDWAQQLQPPAAYEASGASIRSGIVRPELSIEA